MIGTAAFHFRVRWSDEEGARTNALGFLQASLDSCAVWGDADGEGVPGGVKWTWADLLAWLAKAWPFLCNEQGYPGASAARWPDEVTQQGWLAEKGFEVGTTSQALYAFQRRHDLAMALPGIELPSLWILREGERAWVCSVGSGGSRRRLLRPWREVHSTLQKLGDAIAGRLDGRDLDAREVKALWRAREPAPELAAAITMGITPRELQDDWSREACAAALAAPELLMAARMSRVLPVDARQDLVLQLTRLRRTKTPKLDRLSASAREFMEAIPSDRYFRDGLRLAGWLRRHLKMRDTDPCDPEALLRTWGVPVGELQDVDAAIDAVAVWGANHGPAILVNPAGKHSQGVAGRRASLAHETCHLLVDRASSLPLADVLGGGAPPLVETRANAFAAELLAPQEGVFAVLTTSEGKLRSRLEECRQHFGASREVIGWQVANHDGLSHSLSSDDWEVIEQWTGGHVQRPARVKWPGRRTPRARRPGGRRHGSG